MIRVRFTKDRGRRRVGDVVSYDDNSAHAIVEEGCAVYADAPEPPAAKTADELLAASDSSD